jgi:neutral amino acid transport system permease protein
MDFGTILGNALREAIGPNAAFYAVLALGLNVHYGYTGLLNFGQVGFAIAGAYGLGIAVATFGWSMWAGLFLALLFGTLLALALGVPTLRLRGDYFAITTIAAAEVLRLLVRSAAAEPLTGGPYGLQRIATGFYAANPIPDGRYGTGLVSFTHQQLWALSVTWAVAIIGALLVHRLINSPWGRVLKSIREDEDAARSLGKNVFAFKMQALVLGGVLGALAGMLFAMAGSTVNADSYLPIVTFRAYAVLIIGGAATTWGPAVGAMVFFFLSSGFNSFLREANGVGLVPDFFSQGGATGATVIAALGLGLILLMIFRPQGILGDKKEMVLDV